MVEGFVLAGGRSSRMGVDKARLPLRGQPMAEAVAALLRAAGCARVHLIRRGAPDGMAWRTPVIREDESLPRHVLSGFVTAIDVAEADGIVVAACDLFDLDLETCRAVVDAPGAVAWDDGPGILAHLVPADRSELFRVVTEGGSFRRWAAQRSRVEAPGRLANANRWEDLGLEHPIDALIARLHLSGAEAKRAASGERARLAARGCVLP